MDNKISGEIINRLTLYHCILNNFIDRNLDSVSAKSLAKYLNIEDSQVINDIRFLNDPELCSEKYNVKILKTGIEKMLGFKKNKKAFIIGAGNLGMALAKYKDFENYGLTILALFDNDKAKIGTMINNKPILDIEKLPNLIRKSEVDIAILTVPAKYAQVMANYLIASNIKHIWNFAPVVLEVPKDVRVLNENIMGHLLQFTYNM